MVFTKPRLMFVALCVVCCVASNESSAYGAPHPRVTGAEAARRLQGLVERHRLLKAQLPVRQVSELDRLARRVKSGLFANLQAGRLFESAQTLVHEEMPGLPQAQSRALAWYCLNEIVSEGAAESADLQNRTMQMQETQMSFNLQYLQLQSQMQSENQNYTELSNIMKNMDDTEKNTVGNLK